MSSTLRSTTAQDFSGSLLRTRILLAIVALAGVTGCLAGAQADAVPHGSLPLAHEQCGFCWEQPMPPIPIIS